MGTGSRGSSDEGGGGRSSGRVKRGAPTSETDADASTSNSAKRGRRTKNEETEDAGDGKESSSVVTAPTNATSSSQSLPRVAGDKGPVICEYPLSGPWISSHAIHPDPVVIKRPNESIDSKWGMQLYHDITQWGEDWAVVMVSSPGPQKTLSIGDIVLGVNGAPLGGKTFTQAMKLLKESGVYCHLAVARFQGCMTVLVQVPENVCGGDLILAKCPDGNSVEVTVPAGLKGGDTFQLQIKQPQYNSKSALLASNAAKSGAITDRETRYRQNQALFQQEHQKHDTEQQRQNQQQQSSKNVPSVDLVVSPKDPSDVISGDFNDDEMKAMIAGASIHEKDWDKVLTDPAFSEALKSRTVTSCKAKWEQCVALFTNQGNALVKESKGATSSPAKKGRSTKKSKNAGASEVVASAAPSLRTCILCAVAEANADDKGESDSARPRPVEVISYVSEVWGGVYEEQSHADFSWSEKGLKGAVDGKGAISEFAFNPVSPGQLSFETFKFLVDRKKITAMKERARSGSYVFGVDDVCVYESLRIQSNLAREIDSMTQAGILTVDSDGGISLSDNWVEHVGYELLNDFHSNWGKSCEGSEKYFVSERLERSIAEAWSKDQSGWTLVKSGTTIFGTSIGEIKSRYLGMFEKWAQK